MKSYLKSWKLVIPLSMEENVSFLLLLLFMPGVFWLVDNLSGFKILKLMSYCVCTLLRESCKDAELSCHYCYMQRLIKKWNEWPCIECTFTCTRSFYNPIFTYNFDLIQCTLHLPSSSRVYLLHTIRSSSEEQMINFWGAYHDRCHLPTEEQ